MGPSPSTLEVETLAGHCGALTDDAMWNWRWLIGDFVANSFVPATRAGRAAALVEEPAVSDARWGTFVAALAEHLAVHAQVAVPVWTALERHPPVEPFWWPVHVLPSQRPAALATSPASFKRRGIMVDGREIPLVVP